MDSGHHDMAGMKFHPLKDTFAEVALDYIVTFSEQVIVHTTLFCQHGFALYQRMRLVPVSYTHLLEIAGTLFSKINTEINNISDITLTGNINNEDIIVLRNMVQNGSLEYVDMFDSYIHGEGDEDNVIPERCV